MAGREIVIAGNWKMHKTTDEAVAYVKELIPLVEGVKAKVYLAVPFTAIYSVAEAAKGSNVVIGAQNMNDATEGAFTGEIAARMLLDAGAQFVILGHSERRHVFGEDNAFVNRKVKRALEEKIQPILCIGETLEQREADKTEEVLKSQLLESLSEVESLENVIIAYEPVWAIGTGVTATPDQAQEAHAFCRSVIESEWGKSAAKEIVIQYGGSVKPDNAKTLLDQADIDGLLVGGASLTPEIFSQIVNTENKVSL
jgi:triosephosphate isomerase